MTREAIIAAVNAEIVRLEQIRELLVKSHSERFTLDTAATPKKKALTGSRRAAAVAAGKRRSKA